VTGSLAGRTVIITGGARGIGAAIAAGCHAAGATVHTLDVLPADLPADPDGATAPWQHTRLDVTDAEAVAARLAELDTPVDCLVNNAAVSRRTSVTDLDDVVLDQVYAVNLTAPIRLVRQLLPYLRTPGASIVNITSIRAVRGFAGDLAYITAKGGLDAATRAMAVELGPHGIRVNAVAPGAIETDLNRDVLARPGHRDRVLARIPLGRLGRPDDVAGAVVFLAGDAAAFVTGTVLTVDGGQCALG
jgi:NAD(P)-dependent dehydrogenase (short-subunit alcohol dehydrogenase family)